jgi:hypothetical protein
MSYYVSAKDEVRTVDACWVTCDRGTSGGPRQPELISVQAGPFSKAMETHGWSFDLLQPRMRRRCSRLRWAESG